MRKCRWAFVALFAGIPFLAAGPAAGQALDVGFKVGAIFGDLDSDEGGFESETRPALGGGGYLTLWLADYLAVQPELSYMPKGAELGPDAVDLIGAEVALDYVTIPLLLRISAPPSNVAPFGYVGPAIGLRLSCTLSGDDGTGADIETDCDDAGPVGTLPAFGTHGTELGLVAGLGLAVPFGAASVVMEGRLDYGLSNIHDRSGLADSSGADINTRTISVYIGLAVPLSGS